MRTLKRLLRTNTFYDTAKKVRANFPQIFLSQSNGIDKQLLHVINKAGKNGTTYPHSLCYVWLAELPRLLKLFCLPGNRFWDQARNIRVPGDLYTGLVCSFFFFSLSSFSFSHSPQWGAADAGIKVPSCENTELKRSPLKA